MNENVDNLICALIERIESIGTARRIFLIVSFKDGPRIRREVIAEPNLCEYKPAGMLTISQKGRRHPAFSFPTCRLMDFLVIVYFDDYYFIADQHNTHTHKLNNHGK